jgi:hypothetical protein
MPYEPILWGIALAAAAGLRLFAPFVFVGALGRYAGMPTPDLLDWTATDAGFLLLLIATLLEILGDKIPVVDHGLDAVATLLKPAAGVLLPLALVYDMSPAAAWILGIAAGGPLALGIHATKAGTRVASTATTAGTANPFLSFLEDAMAALILLFTLLLPLIAMLLVALLVVLTVRALNRMRRRRLARTHVS